MNNPDLMNKYIELGRPIELRNQIAEENKALIYAGIRIKKLAVKRTDFDFQDVFQEAYIMLLKAIENYDPTRGELSTYYFLQLPSIQRNLYDFRDIKERKRLEEENLYRENPIHFSLISMDTPLNGTDDLILSETIEDESSEAEFTKVESGIDDVALRKAYEEAIDDKKSLEILFKYYGIGTEQLNVSELAKRYSISKSGIHKKLMKLQSILKQNHAIRNLANMYFNINYAPTITYDKVGTSYGISNPTERLVFRRMKLQEMIRESYNKEKVQQWIEEYEQELNK